MTDSEEKEEIIVKAPSKSVISLEKKAEKDAEKALEEERYKVLQIPNKVGKYLGVSSVGLGFAFLILMAYAGWTNEGNWLILTAATSVPVMVLWVVIGLVSAIVGLLLMGSE